MTPALRFALFALLAAACSAPRRPGNDAGTDDDGAMPGVDAVTPTDDASVTTENRLASGVTLTGLALFQGTRVALFEGGVAATRNAPIVAGRAAVVRAYVDPGTRAGQTLQGELEVRAGSTVLAVVRTSAAPNGPSDDAVPSSVIAFDVPASAVTTDATFSVRLTDSAGEAPGATHPARLPRDGSFAPLGAESDGTGLHLVLVPLAWENDGSGRLPDTSSTQLQRIRALLLALYPLAHVNIEVHAPISWSDSLTLGGNVDFGAINGMLMDLRISDGAPRDAYYYALVNAASSYSAYCGSSCVTGQSFVVDDARDDEYRVGSGVGFTGEDSAWTLAHEVGHEHGRSHAPCDTSSSDPDYPYVDGELGAWGLDQRDGTFQPPQGTYDFMSYCDPEWTSDYTWSAMFARTVAVAALASHDAQPSLMVRVGGEVGARIVGPATLRPPHGSTRVVGRWLDASGRTLGLASAPVMPQSHTDEVLAVLPAPPGGAVALRIAGRTLPLDL